MSTFWQIICSILHKKIRILKRLPICPNNKLPTFHLSSCGDRLSSLPHSIFPVTSDSKTCGQQWISVDGGRNSISLWSGWKTLVDVERRVVPKGGLEPPRPFE